MSKGPATAFVSMSTKVHRRVNLAYGDSARRHVLLDPLEDGVQVFDFAESTPTTNGLASGSVHQDVDLHLNPPIREYRLLAEGLTSCCH